MRPLISLLVLPFSAITGVVAYDARAYTFDPQQSPVPPVNRVVTPETARLILISRLGLSESSTLGSVDETVIRDLNTFGGKQTPIMKDAMSDGDYSKLLLVWEGVDIPDLASASKYSSNSFTIPTAPNDLVDDSFIKKSLAQSSTVRTTSKLCPFDFDVEGGFRGSLILYTSQCPSGNNLFPAGTSRFSETAFLKFLARGARSWGGEHTTAILRISSGSNTPAVRKTVFSTLAELSILAKESRQESTMIFADTVPPYHTSNRQYEERERSVLEPRQPKDANDMTRGHKFPSTMMPFCYTDNRTCTEVTNSCSGHGYCYRKFGSKEGSKGDCYACKCGRTVIRTNQDGSVKTVQWGGPACQKKDVSIPFYIIAGISILMVLSIAGGIKMLFSVGMEELPSVIGAGVAVPKSQK
ncbi:hypothetical protein PAAG_07770 [Paracoccidioides lutzii Pb01]|uniref:Vacuolar sorting protein Vps3844 C-terminal domain-containing protein n=1 Tax=Paracoccidioides lutzii (strain ATCC MYA-826 / Pb01) TaxID=502779 RepID=C1HA41_PARBA|nr:hypothetical protein PAAG_07770 [Paracoccidioides lutzii Pb01]EEH37214.2 hypothetical protein PAAG_07770 [Paracoccidioides lutzii Pb01]